MIIEFFKHGTSSRTGSVKGMLDYLAGDKDHKGQDRSTPPVVVSGSRDEFESIASTGKHAEKYFGGVLSFTESLDERTEQKIIKAFEKVMFPGLEPHQYAGVWVRHKEANHELHFAFAGQELSTGNRLDYMHKRDMPRMDAFKNYANAFFDLSDPNDPARKRFTQGAHRKHFAKGTKDALNDLDIYLHQLVANGDIKSRDDAIHYVEDAGFEINRITKTRVSIKNPDRPDGRPIALKSDMFRADFKATPETATRHIQEASEAFKAGREDRIKNEFERMQALCAHRADFNKKRYTPKKKKTKRHGHGTGFTGSIYNNFSWQDFDKEIDIHDYLSKAKTSHDGNYINHNYNKKENGNEFRDNQMVKGVYDTVRDSFRASAEIAKGTTRSIQQSESDFSRISRQLCKDETKFEAIIGKSRSNTAELIDIGKRESDVKREFAEINESIDDYLSWKRKKNYQDNELNI